MAVSQESDFELTTETKVNEIDGGVTTCFMSVEIERMFPRLGTCHEKLRPRDGLQTVDARNL